MRPANSQWKGIKRLAGVSICFTARECLNQQQHLWSGPDYRAGLVPLEFFRFALILCAFYFKVVNNSRLTWTTFRC